MAQISDSKGNITTRQGDTFYIPLTLTQEETELLGTLYLQIINGKRKMMLPDEVTQNVIPGVTEINIPVAASLSDLLVVGKNDDYAEYRYAVKHCSSLGVEDTWIIGGMEFDELPVITVYPKIVNGGIGTDVEPGEDTTSGGNDTTSSEDTTPGGEEENDSINGGE